MIGWEKEMFAGLQESLYCMAESASFNFIFAAVLDTAFSQKR